MPVRQLTTNSLARGVQSPATMLIAGEGVLDSVPGCANVTNVPWAPPSLHDNGPDLP